MFKSGTSGNKKGRPQGAKDKVQSDIKAAFQSLVEGNLHNVEKWLHEVAKDDPAKALNLLLRLSEFIVPKPKALEFKDLVTDEPKQVMIIGGKEIFF